MSSEKRRRVILAAGATAGIGALAGGAWWLAAGRRRDPVQPRPPAAPAARPDPEFPNPLRLPGAAGLNGIVSGPSTLTLSARPVRQEILPDTPSRLLAYETEFQGQFFLNPLLRVRTGARLRVNFWNGLDETSIIHWHGLKVDSNNDGHPHYAVPAGAVYDYHFTVTNRAGTYWYHPHPHHLTGKQVYLGLSGLFIVEDEEELALRRALDLQLGATDVPLVVQDRRFGPGGELVYAPAAAEHLHGHLGGQVLVNLTPRPFFDAATRIYRFRILNGSNARIYRLAFRHGGRLVPFQLIGNDGGLLDRPHTLTDAFVSPAERIDVLLDLREAAPGDRLTLVSLAFDPMRVAAAGEPSHEDHAARAGQTTPGIPEGAEIELMRIIVSGKVVYERAVPSSLSRLDAPAPAGASSREIKLELSSRGWLINGLKYRDDATPIVVRRGSSEIWEIRNAARSMPHPMHVHGFQSRVIGRAGSPGQQARLAVGADGLAATDLGWKDTVLVWPGETVRVLTDFTHPYMGDQVYMVHCHNLEHEDGGMMLNVKIRG